ncbi:MAG: hypothetical protein SNJ59_13005 [Aggregatilineales bacterium]
MALLLRIFGPPHEALHWLALRLIGRRPARVTGRHIDLPPDLTTRQYIFVAGLPAFVFLLIGALGLLGAILSATVVQATLGLLAAGLGMIGLASSAGDLQLIAERLASEASAGSDR